MHAEQEIICDAGENLHLGGTGAPEINRTRRLCYMLCRGSRIYPSIHKAPCFLCS